MERKGEKGQKKEGRKKGRKIEGKKERHTGRERET